MLSETLKYDGIMGCYNLGIEHMLDYLEGNAKPCTEFSNDEVYCDDSGCDYYIYEGVTDEQRQWLEDKLSDVVVEFHKMIGLNPCWFRVVEQEEIDLCEYEKEKKYGQK